MDIIHDATTGQNWHPGGAALNLAVGLARLGNKSALAARIGLDMNGFRLARYLRDEQVALLRSPSADHTGIALSQRINGEPVYTFNDAMYRRRILFTDVIVNAVRSAHAVAVNSFAFDNPEQVAQLVSSVQDRQGLFLVDPNPRPNLINDLAIYKQGFESAARHADIIKLSDEDVALLYGAHAGIDEVAVHLAGDLTQALLFTQGAKGAALFVNGERQLHVDIWQDATPIVDTMGAGDATLASMIDWITNNGLPQCDDGWRRCLERAMRIAAATCRSHGGGLKIPAQ